MGSPFWNHLVRCVFYFQLHLDQAANILTQYYHNSLPAWKERTTSSVVVNGVGMKVVITFMPQYLLQSTRPFYSNSSMVHQLKVQVAMTLISTSHHARHFATLVMENKRSVVSNPTIPWNLFLWISFINIQPTHIFEMELLTQPTWSIVNVKWRK